jgi:hypothetical protein
VSEVIHVRNSSNDLRELRVELSLPGSGLNEMHYLYILPSPPVDLPPEQVHNTPDTWVSSPRSFISAKDRQNLETGWFFYLAEISLKRITSNVLILRHKLKYSKESKVDLNQALETSVTEFETQIHEW